mmetsp:Transcript_253/g.581  ORF Transcript_253/g.581 Transcript_253/m.581 type:complete len:171 (+) Transcript_253:77-589(+)
MTMFLWPRRWHLRKFQQAEEWLEGQLCFCASSAQLMEVEVDVTEKLLGALNPSHRRWNGRFHQNLRRADTVFGQVRKRVRTGAPCHARPQGSLLRPGGKTTKETLSSERRGLLASMRGLLALTRFTCTARSCCKLAATGSLVTSNNLNGHRSGQELLVHFRVLIAHPGCW